MRIFEPLTAPPLDTATGWLNTPTDGIDELTGRAFIVNFCTYTCINWLRQLPYIRAWSHAYRDDGLVVIGVHTPEFSFEHDLDRVENALTELGVDYPVAIDNDYAIWHGFANNYWPALYFIDDDGAIRDFHYGEGRYDVSERVIQKLLGIDREVIPIEAHGIEKQADWRSLRATETYLGYGNGERFSSPGRVLRGEPHVYKSPDRLRSDHWALAGAWTFNREFVELARAGGSISYRFRARDAHLVLARNIPEPIPFRVLLNGEPPGPSHGIDVDELGHGLLDQSRLYQLIRQHDRVDRHALQITFHAAGAEAYAFSFG